MQYALDEFKALRDEVRRCESEALSTTLYVTTAVILATGLAEKAWLPKPIAPIMVQIILLWGMHRFAGLSFLQMKLSSYIQVALEPNLPGLRWERLNFEFEEAEKNGTAKTRGLLAWFVRKASHIFFLLALAGIGLSVGALYDYRRVSLQLALYGSVLFALHVVSTALMLKVVFFAPNHNDYLSRWRDVLSAERGDG